MTALLTADIHETDKPADDYRWELFPWLDSREADELIICGDLSNDKDRHPARLVNRLHGEIMRIRAKKRVIIVKGNHDYFDPNHPFWEFLGSSSNTRFITEPEVLQLSIGDAFFVPAGSDWRFDIPDVDYLFTHATFSGAKAENGSTLTGVDPRVLDDFEGVVYSGDIHVPQTLLKGKLRYIGAPYHVRFGDLFDPRVLRVNRDGKETDLHFPAPRKRSFTITKPEDLLAERSSPGDHVKVTCEMRRASLVDWRSYQDEIRFICEERNWRLFGMKPVLIGEEYREKEDGDAGSPKVVDADDLLVRYVNRQKAGKEFLEAGRRFMAATK